MTGYHHACPIPYQPRGYDCLCKMQYISEDKCAFVHLSTKLKIFVRSGNLNLQGEELHRLISKRNEISVILDGEGDKIAFR